MNKIYLTSLFLIIFISSSIAETVKKIDILNSKRLSKLSILSFIDVNVGDNLNEQKLNEVIKDLYETNFFSNVIVNLDDGVLTIEVVENKIIQSVQLNGVKAKKIREVLLDNIKLKDKSSFNEFYASKDKIIIKNILSQLGYYFAKVENFVEENDNNSVNLVYNIELGEKALIDKIEFTGQKVFKDRKLRAIIVTEENKFWKFISSKKYLNRQQIDLDKRLLKNFYLNNGYYNVSVTSSSAQYLDDNKIKLTFNIDSGSLFKIKSTKLVLPTDYDKNNFTDVENILNTLVNEQYSFIKLNKIVDEINKISLNREYEFITASIIEDVPSDGLLDLTIEIKESERFYVEKINILGNSITQETVIRNSLEVDEGDPFNKLLHAKSINNLKSKNIFAKVDTKIKNGSTQNTKIIDIEIEEKATGEISLGAGVGSEGGTIGFQIKENNYLGKGVQVASSLRLTAESVKGTFSVFNPNFNYTEKSLDTKIESINIDRLSTNGYESSKTGFSLGTGFELYDNFFVSPRISAHLEDLTTNSTATKALSKQAGNYFDSKFGYVLSLDKRNQAFQTTDGYISNFSQTLPLISNNASIGHGYDYAVYNTFFEDYTTSFNFYSRAINSITSDKDVRISERLRLPANRLRGFESGRIGPVDNGDYIGGNYAAAINLTTTLPMLLPDSEKTDFKFFIDGANVWGVDFKDNEGASNKLRSSTGLLVNWFTPIGPMNFSLAHPITKGRDDRTQIFQFNIGTTF